MHHVDWACVNVDVALETGLFGRVLVEGEATVKGPAQNSQRKVAACFTNGEDGREDHGTHECVTDDLVPRL